jgi:hypothetical protein
VDRAACNEPAELSREPRYQIELFSFSLISVNFSIHLFIQTRKKFYKKKIAFAKRPVTEKSKIQSTTGK